LALELARGGRPEEVATMMSQARGFDPNVLVQRVRRLAMLDTSVFEEVRADQASTVPAIIVAAAATILAGVGGWLWWLINDIGKLHVDGGSGSVPSGGGMFIQSLIVGSIISFLLWGVWLAISYVMLTQVFRARAEVNDMVRVMGFAMLPLALSVLIFIPGLDFGIGVASLVILFGATQIAMQTATDAPAGRVLAANGVGFAVWAIVLGLLVTDTHAYAPGFFVLGVGSDGLKHAADAVSGFSF